MIFKMDTVLASDLDLPIIPLTSHTLTAEVSFKNTSLQRVKKLIENGSDVNEIEFFTKQSVLMNLMMNNCVPPLTRLECTRLLVKCGADVNFKVVRGGLSYSVLDFVETYIKDNYKSDIIKCITAVI